MTKANNVIDIEKRIDHPYRSIILWGIVFFLLLLMRDVYNVGINKYIFLAIICLCAVCMNIKHLIYLFCFLFPLYVGLPGNYMTLVLIARLILETRQFSVASITLSAAIAVYMFIQNVITGYIGIVPMMFIAGVALVLLLFTYKRNLEPLPMILMFSAGVAALGFIMLSRALKVYDLSDLMSTSFRLGTSSLDYLNEGVMIVSVDPNFYGMFSITSISMSFPLVFQPKTKLITKVCVALFVFIQLIVCLVGLSRAFIIVFVTWILLYLLSQKNFKGAIIALITIITVISLLFILIPNVIETALARFEESDMATGNGRITLVQKYMDEWSSSIITLLFGVGMYNCNVHCMPLQFLFGGGLVMFVLVVGLFLSYKTVKQTKSTLYSLLPFIVTFIMMCTVPAAGLLNYMFPLVFVGLCGQDMDKVS